MKIVSFNINSVRSHLHQLDALIARHNPDIIGLQETKVSDEEFPHAAINAMGYQAVVHGQKTHYGVALLGKQTPEEVCKGLPADAEDAQRRFIEASFNSANGKKLRVINGYFPQGESRDHPIKFPNKQKFYAGLNDYLCQSIDLNPHLIVMGDFNVAPLDIDIGIGEDNKQRWLRTGKASFLPEEREWLQNLFGCGLHDTFRCKYPQHTDLFSWFDYRSRGFEREPKRGLRIDLLLASTALNTKLRDCGIDYEIRAMDKPSDHCPVWAEFDCD